MLNELSPFLLIYLVMLEKEYNEDCIEVLGIQVISHCTSRDMGYYPFYFQGYWILCSTFCLLSGILASSQANGTNSTFKERSGVSTLGLRRWDIGY